MAKGNKASYSEREYEKIRYWQDAYYSLLFNRGYAPGDVYPVIQERDQLRELNIQQAAAIMRLELMLSAFWRVGDTVYVDTAKAKEIMYLHPDVKPFIRKGLTNSKYYRKP